MSEVGIRTSTDISVIICAYAQERWSDLVDAVRSVQGQTVLPKEIIVVVDYNSTLLQMVREDISGVVAIENTGTRGLSSARNSGIAQAKSPIIAFLDDDAVAMSDWLEMLSVYIDDPQVIGIGGAVHPLWSAGEPAWFPEEFYWVVGCTYRGIPQDVQIIRNPIGANMCLRREVFEAVGGFRDGIGRIGKVPRGCEETELCIRAHQKWPQRIILSVPQACVSHRVSAARTRWHYFCDRCYAEGLSKAAISRYVGARDGLASERAYTFKVLPQGVFRNLLDALLQRDVTKLARAGVIIIGLLITSIGYLVGTILVPVVSLRDAGKEIALASNVEVPNSIGKV